MNKYLNNLANSELWTVQKSCETSYESPKSGPFIFGYCTACSGAKGQYIIMQ